jgi:hypothetical protein
VSELKDPRPAPHFQAGLIGLEPQAAGFVPPKGVLPFLNPVFHVAPAIVDFDHFTGRKSRQLEEICAIMVTQK